MIDSLLILSCIFQVGGENDYPLSNVGPIHHIQDMNPNPGYGGPSSYYSPGSSYHGGGPGTPGSTGGPGGPHGSYPGTFVMLSL